MVRFVLGRILQSVVSVFVLVSVIFFISRLAGDPIDVLAPPQATAAQLAVLEQAYGLDRSIGYQYWSFLQHLVQGDLGVSVFYKSPVDELVIGRIWPSVQLALAALALALLVALPLGVYAASHRGSRPDEFTRALAVLGASVPPFFLGLLLIKFLATQIPWLPIAGRSGPSSLLLPAIALSAAVAAPLMRLTRSSMIEALDSEYVKLARLKGLSEYAVLWRHAFRNACLPVVTYAAVIWAALLGSAVAVEVVFAWPGLGRLIVAAVTNRDFPLIQGIVMILGIAFVVANLLADIAYAYLNPQVRSGATA